MKNFNEHILDFLLHILLNHLLKKDAIKTATKGKVTSFFEVENKKWSKGKRGTNKKWSKDQGQTC